MIEVLNKWIQGIIVAVIITTLIELILPDGTSKKYIKTAIGGYILFVIIYPIISNLSGKSIDLSKISKKFEYKNEAIYESKVISTTNNNIKKLYVENLKIDIIKKLEEKGYIVFQIEISIKEGEKEYGEIKKIEINLVKDDNSVKKIQQINISPENVENSKISNEEIEKIKNILKTEYKVESNNIKIN